MAEKGNQNQQKLSVEKVKQNGLNIINKYLAKRKISENSKKSYFYRLQDFNNWLFEKSGKTRAIEYIDQTLVTQYIRELEEKLENQETKYATYKLTRQVLSGFLKAHGLQDYVKDIPMAKDTKKQKYAPKGLVASEVKEVERAIIRYCQAKKQKEGTIIRMKKGSERVQAVMSLLLYAGLRREEVVNLNRDDIFHRGNLPMLYVKGKGGKEREVPVAKETLQKIEAYLETRKNEEREFADDNPAMFLSNKGERLAKNTVNMYVREISALTNIRMRVGSKGEKEEKVQLHPHLFRHTYAHKLAERKGVDHAMAVLGHEDIRTTMKYLRVRPESVHDVLDDFYDK